MADTDQIPYDVDANLQHAAPGARVLEAQAPGVYKIIDPKSGNTGLFNAYENAKAAGIDQTKINLVTNSPDSAVDNSPVSLVDRMKLSFGDNSRGAVNYLKGKFDDAAVNKNGDMVVNNKGVWHKVDPSLFGSDGWNYAKALGTAVQDPDMMGEKDFEALGVMSQRVAGKMAGAVGALPAAAAQIGATTVTAPIMAAASVASGGVLAPGAVAAEAALTGSAAAAANIASKNVLGRYFGTYDATPEEAAKDAMLDTVLSVGANMVPLGYKTAVKPTVDKALQYASETMSPAVKTLFTNFISGFSHVTKPEAEALINNPKPIAAAANDVIELAKKIPGGATDLAREAAHTSMMMSTIDPVMENAPRFVGKTFENEVAAGAERVAKDYTNEDAKTALGTTMKQFSDAGLVRVPPPSETEAFDIANTLLSKDDVSQRAADVVSNRNATNKALGLSDTWMSPVPAVVKHQEAAKTIADMQMVPFDEFAAHLKKEYGMDEGSAKTVYKKIGQFVSQAKGAMTGEALQGVEAAKQTNALRKGLNDVYFGITNSMAEGSAAQKAAEDLLTPITSVAHQAMNASLANAGEGGQMILAANKKYADSLPVLKELRKVSQGGPNALRTYVNKLGSKTENQAVRQQLETIADPATVQDIYTKQTAGAYARMLPSEASERSGLLGESFDYIRRGAGYVPYLSPTSPRTFARVGSAVSSIKAGTGSAAESVLNMSKTIFNLSPGDRARFLQDPKYMNVMLQALDGAHNPAQRDAKTQQMLQQSGVHQ